MPLMFILIPLVGVILLNLPIGKYQKKLTFSVGIAITLIQVIMSLTIKSDFSVGLANFTAKLMPIELVVGKYSLLVLLLIGLVSFISLIMCKHSTDIGLLGYTNLVLILMLGMNGVVLVNDIFSLYVFLEIVAVCSFVLIAIKRGKFGLEGSFKYLVMSTLATVCMLLGIAILFMMTGSTNYEIIKNYIISANNIKQFQLISAALLFITGLSIKSGLVPFHGWLPDAYTSAPSSVSILLAGIVTKVAGVYALMTIFVNVFDKNAILGQIIMLLGIISILVGAFAALSQKDMKRMLAYSSISQIGYIVLAIGIGTPLALFGAILHFFNHATFKSLLFVNASAIETQTGTRNMDDLGGLAARMPITGGTSVVGFLSTAGIPPLSGFWSKFIIIVAAWQATQHVYAFIAILASVVTLAYFLRLQRKVFFGKLREGLENVVEANIWVKSVSILLSAIIIIMGVLFPLMYIYLQSVGVL